MSVLATFVTVTLRSSVGVRGLMTRPTAPRGHPTTPSITVMPFRRP